MKTEPLSTEPLPGGWTRPEPEHLPGPTAWPAALSLAATLVLWGFVTLWVVTLVGVALFVVSLAGWIHDLRKERHEFQHTKTP